MEDLGLDKREAAISDRIVWRESCVGTRQYDSPEQKRVSEFSYTHFSDLSLNCNIIRRCRHCVSSPAGTLQLHLYLARGCGVWRRMFPSLRSTAWGVEV